MGFPLWSTEWDLLHNGTEMTAAESLDLSLDTFSIDELESWHKEWSIAVNNTHYIRSKRPKGNYYFCVVDESKDIYVVQSETK